ncbi:pheromone-binding protein 2-like [Zerene cesonia]|uniref:pheromone-binding protein 2-like n=1 Tax=Zerene cesonia TaxID=33412 RepID=UPI0018E59405|nr:pheromone-binding protein 2-like [Zerene cesonia]
MAKYLFLLTIVTVTGALASHETLKSITYSFLKVLEECKHELNLTDNILVDLYHFWKEDAALIKRDTGCAIACMSKKLDLVDPSGKLHHGNAQEFALKHGADEEVARKLVTMVHECEQKHEVNDDLCLRALEIAKCFKGGIHELNWAPKMEVMVGEVLTEV